MHMCSRFKEVDMEFVVLICFSCHQTINVCGKYAPVHHLLMPLRGQRTGESVLLDNQAQWLHAFCGVAPVCSSAVSSALSAK